MNLVYDRTAQDVETARTQRGTTLTPLKGCYNITDLNRVESAVKLLSAALTSAGYAVTVVDLFPLLALLEVVVVVTIPSPMEMV